MNQSLYDKLGGERVVEDVVDQLYARILLDSSLKPFFAKTNMESLRNKQAQFISFIIGGPDYTGKSIDESHKNRNIDESAFNKVVEHLEESLKSAGVDTVDIKIIIESVAALKSRIVGH